MDRWPTRPFINAQMMHSNNSLVRFFFYTITFNLFTGKNMVNFLLQADYLRHITLYYNKTDVHKIIEKNLVKINIRTDLLTIRVRM